MFTGLVEAVGQLLRREEISGGLRCQFSQPWGSLEPGESIAVSGACLTVVSFSEDSFTAELSTETLQRTTLGGLQEGDAVNLERALRFGDRLGGHLVSGHVDGVGAVRALSPVGEMLRAEIELPAELRKYVAEKGSLTVEGVSLTVNAVTEDSAELLLIPHTREVTTWKHLHEGSPVNLEIDLIARYVERLLQFRQ